MPLLQRASERALHRKRWTRGTLCPWTKHVRMVQRRNARRTGETGLDWHHRKYRCWPVSRFMLLGAMGAWTAAPVDKQGARILCGAFAEQWCTLHSKFGARVFHSLAMSLCQ